MAVVLCGDEQPETPPSIHMLSWYLVNDYLEVIHQFQKASGSEL